MAFETPQFTARCARTDPARPREVFDYTWLIGLALFGVHLMLLGYLVVPEIFLGQPR